MKLLVLIAFLFSIQAQARDTSLDLSNRRSEMGSGALGFSPQCSDCPPMDVNGSDTLLRGTDYVGHGATNPEDGTDPSKSKPKGKR